MPRFVNSKTAKFYGHDSHLASLDRTYGVGAAMENMGGDAWQSSDLSPGPWIQHLDTSY